MHTYMFYLHRDVDVNGYLIIFLLLTPDRQTYDRSQHNILSFALVC